ncbi:MAG: ABC-type sugar transport system, periplasmic component, partial [Frankiales bacterium]|nr:ABC-type sugar transport system, periplasmic component [Frankiales bacterium]
AKSGGAFVIKPQALPTNPDGQREQLVRRLASADSSIDLIGMDVTWTAEFAQAGWISAFKQGELTNVGDESKVLAGPWASAQYQGQQFGAPLNSNTRLLWYRKSLLGSRPVPQTWDQLIDTATQLNSSIEETGKRAESLNVTFNALVASAGGAEVKQDGDTTVVDLPQQATEKAISILARLAQAPLAPTGLTNAGENENRLGFQTSPATSAFMINWPFVWPSVVKADAAAGTKIAQDYGWAPYPRVDPATPAKAPLGGYNLGLGAFSRHRAAAVAAINCLTDPEQQRTIATVGGQPSVLRDLGDDPAIVAKLPMVTLMAQQLETASPRPVTPNYSEVSLAVREILHPTRSLPTDGKALTSKYKDLRDLVDRALKSEAVL